MECMIQSELIYFKIGGFLLSLKFLKDFFQGRTRIGGARPLYRDEEPIQYWFCMMLTIIPASALLYFGYYYCSA